jgi:hypothetical protein
VRHRAFHRVTDELGTAARGEKKHIPSTLLLDSRVVDVPRAYNRTFVMLSSLKPFFFNSLQKELRFSNNAGA